MKFGQSIEYNKTKIFFENHAQNEVERLVPDDFVVFKKALQEAKASGQQPSFNIFR